MSKTALDIVKDLVQNNRHRLITGEARTFKLVCSPVFYNELLTALGIRPISVLQDNEYRYLHVNGVDLKLINSDSQKEGCYIPDEFFIND